MKVISTLYDYRSLCNSILIEIELSKYLDLVEKIYEKNGGIKGQRGVIKTKSAKTIRDRMIDDIKRYAVLPPVVIGAITDEENIEIIIDKELNQNNISLSIIDGMQRTTAYMEALEETEEEEERIKLSSQIIRVEFWLGKTMNSLLYRMLVLNTGQIPWNARRQLETIYQPVIEQIDTRVEGITLQKIDEGTKRSKYGQFPADKIMELLICFTSRSPIVNMKDTISEEFAKLDIIETSSYKKFDEYFIKSLSILVRFDKLIFDARLDDDVEPGRFKNGSDLFTSQPARIGLMTAISKFIFGLKGSKITEEKTFEKMNEVNKKFDSIFDRLEQMNNKQKVEFLSFDTLNEKTNVLTSKVGDFERKYFTSSFETVFSPFMDLETFDLSVLWRSE